MTDILLTRWTDLWKRLGVEGIAVEATGHRLLDSYAEKIRHYHNRDHIEEVLGHFDWAKQHVSEVNGIPDAERRRLFDTIELAIFYHDVVYNPKAKDNEAQSRNRLLNEARQLGLAEDIAAAAAGLVDITANHMMARSLGEKIIVDCDLASLGSAPEKFKRNTDNIRLEYAHVPNLVFNAGQRKYMTGFLSTKFIYKTEAFRREREAQARKNLAELTVSPLKRFLKSFSK